MTEDRGNTKDQSPGLGSFGRAMLTSFGLGMMRPASGTWGSLPPAAVGAGIAMSMPISSGQMLMVWYVTMSFFVVVFSWACLRFGDDAEAMFGKKDPGQIVADETAGMGLTLACLPMWVIDSGEKLVLWIGVGFVVFRVADIVKLPPARGIQRLKGGAGVLLDDLIAGMQSGAVLIAAGLLLG